MLKKYYSATDSSKLLHMVCRTNYVSMKRTDVVEEDEFLQLAILKMEQGKTFAPHKHIFKEVPPEAIAQESWVVMRRHPIQGIPSRMALRAAGLRTPQSPIGQLLRSLPCP